MSLNDKTYSTIKHRWKGEDWILHPLKGMFWVAEQSLLVTDLHLGKTRHFQRAGIHLPEGSDKATLNMISEMIHTFSPAEVWILGDLFHSYFEQVAWDRFAQWIKTYNHISWSLVLGNHDLIDRRYYDGIGVSCFDRYQTKAGIELVHSVEINGESGATISGHIHPGIELRGKGKQRLVLPCFHFTESSCVLPALGQFTGLSRIKVQTPLERVFVATGEKVIAIPGPEAKGATDKS